MMCRMIRAFCHAWFETGKRDRLPRYEKYATSSSAGLLRRIPLTVNGNQGQCVIRAVAVIAQTPMYIRIEQMYFARDGAAVVRVDRIEHFLHTIDLLILIVRGRCLHTRSQGCSPSVADLSLGRSRLWENFTLQPKAASPRKKPATPVWRNENAAPNAVAVFHDYAISRPAAAASCGRLIIYTIEIRHIPANMPPVNPITSQLPSLPRPSKSDGVTGVTSVTLPSAPVVMVTV